MKAAAVIVLVLVVSQVAAGMFPVAVLPAQFGRRFPPPPPPPPPPLPPRLRPIMEGLQSVELVPLRETPFRSPGVVIGVDVDVRPVDAGDRERGYYARASDTFRLAGVAVADRAVVVRLVYTTRTGFPPPPSRGEPPVEAPTLTVDIEYESESDFTPGWVREQLERAFRIEAEPETGLPR